MNIVAEPKVMQITPSKAKSQKKKKKKKNNEELSSLC